MRHKIYSAYKLFGTLILGIFGIELFIMFLLSYLPESNIPHLDNIIDALILVLTVSPLVYFASIKPLQEKMDELRSAKAVIHDLNRENEIEKTRKDLLALASHQLRTPLSGTKWLIETLQKGIPGKLSEKQSEYLGELYKINESMTSLVNDMFNVVRLEEEHGEVKLENVIIQTAFTNVVTTLSGKIEKKNIKIAYEGNSEYSIWSNMSLFQNLLQCLVSNAVTYSLPESQIIIGVIKSPEEVVVSIKDSGIGIPKDEQKRLFERFYRASNAKTFYTQGTGLGLYIAATIAKKLGVRITLESEIGKGSTFSVHFPSKNTSALPESATTV